VFSLLYEVCVELSGWFCAILRRLLDCFTELD
jgi:hypothetical protein